MARAAPTERLTLSLPTEPLLAHSDRKVPICRVAGRYLFLFYTYAPPWRFLSSLGRYREPSGQVGGNPRRSDRLRRLVPILSRILFYIHRQLLLYSFSIFSLERLNKSFKEFVQTIKRIYTRTLKDLYESFKGFVEKVRRKDCKTSYIGLRKMR